MDGGYPYPSEIEEGDEEMLSLPEVFGTGISVCTVETDNSPVSPKNREEMSTAPEIFSSDDTTWVANEQIVKDSTSLPHDYVNVMQSAVENPTEAIPFETLDSPPATAIISEQSPSALMNSEGLQLDLLNHTGADQVSTENPEASLFQVMKIVSDKQELSFVEKVHIPEEQILRLCNRILPNAAENQCPDIKINFNTLNHLSLPTIGLYGDKRTMGRILKEMGVVDDSIHMQMEEEKLEPGLYVGVLKQVIIVFYWHQGTHLKNASRKEVSCNFIRYVVDLCDDIYVCVEEYNLLEALAASAVSTSHRQRRTQRLKINHVQNSENDVRVSSGFNLNIRSYISSRPPPEGLAIPRHTLFFAEGYHRCAFITANYKESRKYFFEQLKKVNLSALGSELEQLSKDYDLDFTRLSNDEFVYVLEHFALPEYQSYRDLTDNINDRRAENRKFNLQSKLKELEEQILQNFLHVLPEYCSFILYLSDSAYEEREHVAAQEIPVQITRFAHLEDQLTTIWGANSGKQKLLFPGSEIKFHTMNEAQLGFVIEMSGKSAHPILFEEEIMLGGTGEGDNTNQKAKILPIGKYGSVKKRPVLSGEQLNLQFGSSRKFSGVIEVIQIPDNALHEWIKPLVPKKLQKVAQNIVFLGFLMSNGILEQLKSFGQAIKEKLLMEELNAESLQKKPKSTEGYFITKRLLLAFLMSDDNFDQVKNFNISDMKEFLTFGSHDVILSEIESGKADLSPELQESSLQWLRKFYDFKLDETSGSAVFEISIWRDTCSSIYRQGREEFRENILALIRKDMLTPIQDKIQSEKLAAEKLQEQQLKDELENFLTETKKKLSQKSALGRLLYIESCHVIAKSSYGLGKIEACARSVFGMESSEVQLKILSEEEEKPSIQWMIVELAPKKKDLDALNSNSMHCIVPSCSDSSELVCCDPEIEDLKMVAFLRSGELLVFVHDKVLNGLHLYMSPKLGPFLSGSNPVRTFKRGFDLLAFDECTRFVALYDAQLSKIQIYRFDESFRNIDWTGVEVMLESFTGSTNIKWMQCVPGKAELLLVDDTNRVRVVELLHHPLMKPKHITLSSNFLSAHISGDGSFLFVFQQSAEFSDHKEECVSSSAPQIKVASEFELKVYMLGDTMSFLKNIFLDINVEDAHDLQVKLVYYGCQIHLVIHSDVLPGFFSSNILNLVSATEVLEFQELTKQKSNSEIDCMNAMDQDSQKSCATLDYIYHIFDKFAVSPALCRGSIRDLNFHVLLKSRDTLGEELEQRKCGEYLKILIGRLEKEKGKDFSNLRIQFQVQMSESWESNSIDVSCPLYKKRSLGNWVRQLICLVPIQITRAENNGLQPLLDGLRIPPQLTYADSISLATLMRFGLYDAVLSQWDGKIKVVSSMGKQSSGKSYLLNHLSGSLLDVAGGRCTDGVWITVRMDSKCLYVLMDFEGLGSFERTEQEDMLLSVLNAALSNLTIFNKKDFHLDKETEAIFQRFQSGVNLVKNDEKLFQGLFYIAIKDVDVSDVEDLKDEFRVKLLQICKKSRENFLTKMYGGMVELAAMPPFTRREYHQESLSDIALTIEEELGHSYESGRAFLRDMKLVIAQIAAKDWTPVDLKRVAMKVDILRRNLVSAVKAGCLSMLGANKALMNFDSQEEVEDAPIELEDLVINLQDTGLELAALDESTSNESILCHLRSNLESVFERRGKNGDFWHSKFQDLLVALADRRCDRVEKWLCCNTAEFSGNNDVQKLQLEAVLVLAEMKQGLSVCGCKCSICFWRCVLEKGHSSDHYCMGSHVCDEKCTFCSLESHQGTEVQECQNLAGHDGSHDCKRKNHTCMEICSLFGKSSNCSKSCCLKVGHEGLHKCNSPQHMCKMKCSLPSCKNPCVIQIELGDHEKHACHERYCPKKCIMEGCPRSCGYEDHFHEFTCDEHLCGNEHSCRKKCEADGICEIFTELVRHTRSFTGRRGCFQYEHVSEQNGRQKDCCIAIPPFERYHDGVHLHTLNPDAVHYCKVRCQACGYFCQKPINHSGLHHTVHGNMRNVFFASEHEEFDIEGRKYTWGESGMAEMCNMHCKAQGRGHIHLIHCPIYDNCTSRIYDGSRHETRKYGPDEDEPKDELTHETYWKQMRFEDPCSEDDQKEFALCNHLCRSEEHNEIDGSSSRSYCTEKLWHIPVKRTASMASSIGHITADGHLFVCDHSKNIPHHVVFVIDKSGSMSNHDIKPTMAKFTARHNCRLGCVYEAIVRFIATRRRTTSNDSLSVVLFDNTAILALEMQEMKEALVDRLLQYVATGGTSYSSGLKQAEDVIYRGSNNPDMDKKKPTIIFLSDGGNNDRKDPVHFVTRLKKIEPGMIFHTIMFGTDPTVAILEKMAVAGNGYFQHSLDEVQLARSFENLATSLKPNVAALI